MDRARLFLDYANKCDRYAATAREPRLADLFQDLAVQWRSLAGLAREMAEDSKQAAEFFQSGH